MSQVVAPSLSAVMSHFSSETGDEGRQGARPISARASAQRRARFFATLAADRHPRRVATRFAVAMVAAMLVAGPAIFGAIRWEYRLIDQHYAAAEARLPAVDPHLIATAIASSTLADEAERAEATAH